MHNDIAELRAKNQEQNKNKLSSAIITGLVPALPTRRGTVLFSIGMAGTGPAMTGRA
jgi:hypothetical protein